MSTQKCDILAKYGLWFFSQYREGLLVGSLKFSHCLFNPRPTNFSMQILSANRMMKNSNRRRSVYKNSIILIFLQPCSAPINIWTCTVCTKLHHKELENNNWIFYKTDYSIILIETCWQNQILLWRVLPLHHYCEVFSNQGGLIWTFNQKIIICGMCGKIGPLWNKIYAFKK